MNFTVLVKPASADCNLRCEYCFYLDRSGVYPETAVHRMSDAVLQRLVRSYLETDQPVHSFVWQGGEPLLMGEGFYERVADLQLAYARRGGAVSNAIQTNGVLLNDRLAKLFRACRFLTGVSLDGPAELHDAARLDRAGGGSHKKVLEGIGCLKRNGAEFNVLTLVSQHNVRQPVEVYEYLVDQVGSTFLQFIECVELDEEGRVAPYCVSPEEWGTFLCAVFDRWFERDSRKVSVRLFDTVLAKLVTGRDICCTAGLDCRQYFVVEYNGDVYPCDFHVIPELRLGNILTDSWETLASSPVFRTFGERKRQTEKMCGSCPYFAFCAGDCPKNRVGHTAGPASRLSYLCEGWKLFYAHTLPRFTALAEQIKSERKAGLT